MKLKIKLCPVTLMVILAILAILSLTPKAQAQPYFTNSTPANGAYTYNQNFATPLQPSKTLANQYASGTLAGSFPPGTVPYQGFYTNTFGTNIFSTAPFVIVATSGTNSIAAVTSVTTTNFVVQQLGTNQTIYWEATGH